ncbi:hypothetical protein FBU30_003043 [Linnemannia zychae]|nr:hypothetical protein FBU30_003043 [Linnemannia zychae]
MAAAGTSSSSNKSSGFMSGYMSDLSQSQDLNSFLQKNQPTYNSDNNSTTKTSTGPADTKTGDSQSAHTSTSTSTGTSASLPSLGDTPSNDERQSFKGKTGSHPLPTAHSIYQKKAINNAALDNCADLNMDLTDCLTGRTGTWWDRASMCMKAKEALALCCKLNREILQERGYANEGNTAAQDLAILDYADEVTQKAMKEDSSSSSNTTRTSQE